MEKKYEDYLILESIYEDDFDIELLTDEQKKEFSKNKFIKKVSRSKVLILTIITLGIYGIIWYGLQYSKLPKIKEDDFGSKKAIGYLFIPFFGWYWIFKFWTDFIYRVNLQLKLNGFKPLSKKEIENVHTLKWVHFIMIISSVIPALWVFFVIAYIIQLVLVIDMVIDIVEYLAENNREKIKNN